MIAGVIAALALLGNAPPSEGSTKSNVFSFDNAQLSVGRSLSGGQSGFSGIEGRRHRRDEGKETANRLDERQPERLDTSGGLSLSGARSAGLLNKIVGLNAVILGCFLAGLGLAKGFPAVPNGREMRWLAVGSAGPVVVCAGILIAKAF